LGVDGDFCKHCVAVALTWLESGADQDGMPSIRRYLEGLDKPALVDLLMEQVMESETLSDRLEVAIVRQSRKPVDVGRFKKHIKAAFRSGGYIDYR
jgi:uncharacterized Zn finger protein